MRQNPGKRLVYKMDFNDLWTEKLFCNDGKEFWKRGGILSPEEFEVNDLAGGLSVSHVFGSSKVTLVIRRFPKIVLLNCDIKDEKVGASSSANMCAQNGLECASLPNSRPDLAMVFS